MAEKEEKLQQLLNKIATEQKYENHELIINEISSGGANYTSKLYTVIIREENKEDLRLFAKIAAAGEDFRKDMPSDMYDIEQFAYTKLLKMYTSLEEENDVPEEHRLIFTKCYGFHADKNEEIIVLDNLLAQGYGPHDRFKCYDWEYASSAITDLAKMHALSFALSKRYPEEFENTLVFLKMNWNESKNLDNLVKRMANHALNNIKPEYREALEKFVEDMQHPFKMYGAVRRTAIVHADYRGNNLLHKVQEDGKVVIKILDLQTIQGGSPVTDLLYFILTGSDEEFRAKYYEQLIDHYYTQLSASMKRLNLDPEETYSRDDFEFELKEKMPFGLAVAIFLLPVITIDSDNAPEVSEALNISNFGFDKTNDLYTERLNGIVKDFLKWGILK